MPPGKQPIHPMTVQIGKKLLQPGDKELGRVAYSDIVDKRYLGIAAAHARAYRENNPKRMFLQRLDNKSFNAKIPIYRPEDTADPLAYGSFNNQTGNVHIGRATQDRLKAKFSDANLSGLSTTMRHELLHKLQSIPGKRIGDYVNPRITPIVKKYIYPYDGYLGKTGELEAFGQDFKYKHWQRTGEILDTPQKALKALDNVDFTDWYDDPNRSNGLMPYLAKFKRIQESANFMTQYQSDAEALEFKHGGQEAVDEHRKERASKLKVNDEFKKELSEILSGIAQNTNRQTAIKAAEQLLYHGSPKKLKTLYPHDASFLGVPDSVFATPHESMALAYTGGRWSDRDLAQGGHTAEEGEDPTIKLTEMRADAFKDIFAKRTGYLHSFPSDGFTELPSNPWEFTNPNRVKPTKIQKILDVLKALQEHPNVEMSAFDPKGKDFAENIGHSADRLENLDETRRSQYLKWIALNAPQSEALQAELKSRSIKAAEALMEPGPPKSLMAP